MAVVRRKSTEMSKFLDGAKGRLVGHVDRHLLTRPKEDRPSNVLHPSAMAKTDWCPRAAWFVVTGRIVENERNNLRRSSIFAEGHAIHDKWQNWFWEMGNLYGLFRCRICSATWWDRSPLVCAKCPSTLLQYREVPLLWEDALIAGHADGWIKGLAHDCLIEIKSVGSGTIRMEAPKMFSDYNGDFEAMWRALKRPFPSHLRQGQIYLRVLNETSFGGPAPQEMVFVYESKFTQEPKEFVVPYDTRITDGIIEKAFLVKAGVDSDTPPACPDGECKQCKGLAA